jgi:putative ABC transport system substrate-binding protein
MDDNGRRRRCLVFAALAGATLGVHAAPGSRRLALLGGPADDPADFTEALLPFGWRVGDNLRIEARTIARFAPAGEMDAAVTALMATRPDVIFTTERERVSAVLRATRTTPVVAILYDAVREGFAHSLSRPGGNVTGLSVGGPQAFIMQVEALSAMLPGLRVLHAMGAAAMHRDSLVQQVRAELHRDRGFEFVAHDVTTNLQAQAVLASVKDSAREALIVNRAPGLDVRDIALRARAARVATVGGDAEAGILVAASPPPARYFDRVTAILDKVLRGADPATTPFEQRTDLGLEINRATATALGIAIPTAVALRVVRYYE